MLFEKNIVSIYRYIHLWIGSQCFCHGFRYHRHISQSHSFATEESVFILFTPTYQFGNVYFYYIGHVRRYFLRHNHVVGNNPADTIHLFYFDSRHCYRSNLRTCLFRRNSNWCFACGRGSNNRCRLRFNTTSSFLLFNIIFYIFLTQSPFITSSLYSIQLFFRNFSFPRQLNHNRRVPTFFLCNNRFRCSIRWFVFSSFRWWWWWWWCFRNICSNLTSIGFLSYNSFAYRLRSWRFFSIQINYSDYCSYSNRIALLI